MKTPWGQRTNCLSLILALMVMGAPGSNLAGAQQQPRIRTLTYEPQQKEWVEQAPPLEGTADGDLYAIQVQIHDGHYRRALTAVNRFVKTYGKADPAYPEALIAKAEALIAQLEADHAALGRVVTGEAHLVAIMDLLEEAIRLLKDPKNGGGL